MKNLLFVCTMNRDRSCTAEDIFVDLKGYKTRSRGTHSEAVKVISGEDLVWSDMVFCMEDHHAKYVREKFPVFASQKNIMVLNIDDVYRRGEDELETLLKVRVSPYL
jgi:predicted protein tyrosine phosphatase